jgi:hypothetical protein
VATERYTRAEVLHLFGVSEEFLLSLEREEIVGADERGAYSHASVECVRVCWNLQHELGVNMAGQEVVLHLLERIERERTQFQEVLRYLQERLSEPG